VEGAAVTVRGKKRSQTTVEVLPVDLGPRSYSICVGAGLLDEAGPRSASLLGPQPAAVVTNPTVGDLYLDRLTGSLQRAGFEVRTIEVPDGEEHKNAKSLLFIHDRLLDPPLERTSPIFALGGGVVGDLTGFAAATCLRGMPFVQLPTTLLAQVDSSVGGKTGINHPAGKNLIGAFYQPKLVLIDTDTLQTLPRRELLAGMAEVIKYGAILDADLFTLLEKSLEQILALDADLLREVVRRCCAIKADVVRRDERESDYRAVLNFGHTMGHAIERLTDYKRYLHGEAVAIGMAFAARVSRVRGSCDERAEERLVELLKRAGLPVDLPDTAAGDALERALAADKKMTGGKIKFVCMEGLGRARFEAVTTREIAEIARS
jgi:3-dehydroquinate synthase